MQQWRNKKAWLAIALAFTILASSGSAYAQTMTTYSSGVVSSSFSSGEQLFLNQTILSLLPPDTISGGYQYFYDDTQLTANGQNAITGGIQQFYNSSALNAFSNNSLSGGQQYFGDNSEMLAWATNAIVGGEQSFFGYTTLNVGATGAINGGVQQLLENSTLKISMEKSTTNKAQIYFVKSANKFGGTIDLNGFSTAFGGIRSQNLGAGRILNNGSSASEMTIDTSVLGDSEFSGTIVDGSSALSLVKAGNGTLTLSGTNSYSGLTTISGGTLIAASANALGGTANGTIVQNGATLALKGGIAIGNEALSLAGTGVALRNVSGNNSFAGAITITDNVSISSDAGMLTLTGAISNVRAFPHILYIDGGGDGTIAGSISNTIGTLDQQSSGTWTLTGTNQATGTVVRGGSFRIEDFGYLHGNSIYVDGWNTPDASVTIKGQNARAEVNSVTVGNYYNGKLDIENGGSLFGSLSSVLGKLSGVVGTINVTGKDSNWRNNGTLSIGGFGTGTLTVSNGGMLENNAAAIMVAQNPGSFGTLNIGAAAGNTASAAGTVSTGTVQFGAGTATVVFNHTGNPDGSALDFAPIIAGAGTIKHLSGDTIFSANNASSLDFTGQVDLSGGHLAVNGIFGDTTNKATAMNVSGGVLSGIGTIAGSVNLTSGALSRVAGQTLTIGGNLTLGSGDIDVSLGIPNTSALFAVGGNLTLGGTLNIADAGGFGPGIYRLFDYAGTLTNNGLVFGSTPSGISTSDLSVQTAVVGQVYLVSTAGALLSFWDGGNTTKHSNGVVDGGNGIWRADGQNWTDQTGQLNGPFQPNPTFAVFQGSDGLVTVDNSAGPISVSGMQFASSYQLAGDSIELSGLRGESIIRVGDGSANSQKLVTISSSLTGASTLVKTDIGVLVLSGANTFTGGLRIEGGVVKASSDANLGAPAGAIMLKGGDLSITGTSFTSTARPITIGAGSSGINIEDATNTFTIAQAIGGSGQLVKLGAGTLVVTGASSARNAIVVGGTLVGNASSIIGFVRNDSKVVFDQATDASFAGELYGYTNTAGIFIKRGAGTLTLSGTSESAWTVDTGGLVSTSDKFFGDLAIASGATFTFDQAYAGSYAGKLTGAGALDLKGGGKVNLTGDSASFAGLTRVANGVLSVNDHLGGSALIDAGGRLQGTGTIGSGPGSVVTIASGGTLAPGNSIGTLSVNGNLVMNAGSRYEVEVAPGGAASDRFVVSGTATLGGGTVAHVGMTGTYDPTATYTILTATGGLTGRFDAVTSSFAFLNAALGYDAHAVTLTLTRNDRGFKSAGATPNQIATAQSLDTLRFGNALFDKVVQLDTSTAQSAFDQLSGEIHASALTGILEDSRFLRNAANDRLRTTLAEHTPTSTTWANAYGAWGNTNSDGNAAALDRTTGGLIFGADTSVFDTWRFGVLGGYGHSGIAANALGSSAAISSYHLGLYGGTQWNALSFRTGLAYSWNDIDTQRRVDFTGLSNSLSSSYHAGTVQAFGELGYGIDTTLGCIEPFANLAHIIVSTSGFTESGGAAALGAPANDNSLTFITLGIRGESIVDFGAAQAKLTGMLGWRHAFGDTATEVTQAFAGANAFTVAGAPIAKDALTIEAGLTFDLSTNATLGLAYQAQIANQAQDHGLKAQFNVRF